MKWKRKRDGTYYLEREGGTRVAAIWPAKRLCYNSGRVYLWSSMAARRDGWTFTLAQAKKEVQEALGPGTTG